MRKVTLALMIAISAGCAMPTTSVRSVDTRPSVSIQNVGDNDELFIDGVRVGMAADYREPNHLLLAPGTHRISIVEGKTIRFEQTIFVESEHKNIIVR